MKIQHERFADLLPDDVSVRYVTVETAIQSETTYIHADDVAKLLRKFHPSLDAISRPLVEHIIGNLRRLK